MKPPETDRAILMCRTCRRPTQHEFVGRGQKMSPGLPSNAHEVDLLFACKCGAARIWGNEPGVASDYLPKNMLTS